MSVASSDRASLRYNIEATYGVTPDVKMTDLRFTGESLKLSLSNTESQEISDARQVRDLVQTGAECGGDINFELSGDTYNDFLLALIGCAAWTNVVTITANTGIACTAGTGPTDLDEISSAAAFGSVVDGQWLMFTGFANEANNGPKQVKTATASLLTLTSYGNVVNEAAGASVNVTGKMLRNPATGAAFTMKSFSIERYHSDIEKYFIFKGMRPNSISMNFATGSIITGSINFLGKSSEVGAATFVPSNAAGVNPATTTKVLNAITDVKNENIMIDGEVVDSSYISGLNFTISNNLRGIKAIGYKGNAEIAEGRFSATGSLNIYFNDTKFYDKYVNSSEFSIGYSVGNVETGKGYAFTFTRSMISDDGVNASGTGQDIVENMNWQALMNAQGFTVQIDSF